MHSLAFFFLDYYVHSWALIFLSHSLLIELDRWSHSPTFWNQLHDFSLQKFLIGPNGNITSILPMSQSHLNINIAEISIKGPSIIILHRRKPSNRSYLPKQSVTIIPRHHKLIPYLLQLKALIKCGHSLNLLTYLPILRILLDIPNLKRLHPLLKPLKWPFHQERYLFGSQALYLVFLEMLEPLVFGHYWELLLCGR